MTRDSTHNLNTPKMNYDFQTNWDSMVLPLLSLPHIKKSIKKGVKNILSVRSNKTLRFSAKKPPAEYQFSDSWCVYMDEFTETLTKKLLEDGILQPDKNAPSPDADGEEFDDYYESSEFAEYEKYKEQVIRPYVNHHEKTSLRAYQLFMACHWWNPTFGLTLARTVCPREKWFVKYGEDHTTIVNADKTKVFDILYFDPDDPTFGGELAISKSLKPTRIEHHDPNEWKES